MSLTDQRIPGLAPLPVGTVADLSLYLRTAVLVGGVPGPGASVDVIPVLPPPVPQSRCVSHSWSLLPVAPLSQGNPSPLLLVSWTYALGAASPETPPAYSPSSSMFGNLYAFAGQQIPLHGFPVPSSNA